MSYRPSLDRFSKQGINGKTSGSTLVGTTPAGTENFYALFASVRLRAGSGITVMPAFSIGTNSPNYDNIMPATVATGLSVVDNYMPVSLSGAKSMVPPSTGIYLKVGTIAVATTYTVDATLIGYFE